MNALNSKAKVEEDEDNIHEDSLKEEYMNLFLKPYNKYVKKFFVRHSDKKLVKLRKPNPPKKLEDKKKE